MTDQHVPETLSDLSEMRVGGRDCIVDQHIYPAVCVYEVVKHRLTLRAIPDVRQVPGNLGPKPIQLRFHQRSLVIELNIIQPDIRAVLRENARDAGTDTAPRARDECFLAFQQFHIH